MEARELEIRRDYYLKKLISKKHNGLIKVITGMRRCGKSYLLFTIFRNYLLETGVPADHIIDMAFDSYENKKYRDPDVLYPHIKNQISDHGMYYILLDEVQLLAYGSDILWILPDERYERRQLREKGRFSASFHALEESEGPIIVLEKL